MPHALEPTPKDRPPLNDPFSIGTKPHARHPEVREHNIKRVARVVSEHGVRGSARLLGLNKDTVTKYRRIAISRGIVDPTGEP